MIKHGIIQDILCTIDNVIFTISENELEVLLVHRPIEPFKDSWTLPGWFVWDKETLEMTAYKKLKNKTNIKNVYLEQLYTFSNLKRDPRWRVISTAYMAISAKEDLAPQIYENWWETKFFWINSLPKLWFDHQEIINYAIHRLKRKLEYTNIAKFILPKNFTLTQLQNVYEKILNKKFDVRNFRKKINNLGIIEDTWEKETWNKYRPARLFKFKNSNIEIINIL